MLRLLILVLGISVYITPSALALENEPPEEALRVSIQNAVPSYWEIENLRIVASVQEGDEINPVVRQRFEADLTPTSTLYVKDDKTPPIFKPFVALIPATEESRVRTLYGTVRFEYVAGKWNGDVNLENDVKNQGIPRSLFDQPTFVLGSEKEEDLIDRLKANRIGGLRAELERARENLLTRHSEEMAELRKKHEENVQSIKEKHAQELTELKSEQEAKLADIKQKHREKIKDLESNYADTRDSLKEQIETTRAKLENRLKPLRDELKAEKQKLVKQHEAEIADLTGAHREKIQKLENAQAEQVAELKAKHKEKMRELKQEYEAIERDQQQKIETLRTRHAEKITKLKDRVKATDQQLTLRKKLEKKRDDLAALEKSAMQKRTKRAEGLIEEFREQAKSPDPAVRRQVFLEALDSEHGAVRDAAMRLALEDEQQDVRQAAIEKALQKGDWAVQRKALAKILQRENQITLRFPNSNVPAHHMRLKVDEDKNVTGIRTDHTGKEFEIVAGAIRRPGITWTDDRKLGSYSCSIRLVPDQKAQLVGAMTCQGDESVKVEVSLF